MKSSSYYKSSKKPSKEQNSLWIVGDGEPRLYGKIQPFEYDIQGLRKEAEDKKDRLDEKSLEKLCRKYEIFSGKWVFETEREKVDQHWDSVVELLDNNQIYFAKVSTQAYTEKINNEAGEEIISPEKHFILTYTEDYRNEEDVLEVGDLLTKRGMEDIGYKRDVLTALGIHSDREGIEYFKYKINECPKKMNSPSVRYKNIENS